MSFQNFMLDIETLGTDPDAVILSIGCAAFDKDFKVSDSFYIELETTTQCRSVHISTVRWWATQATGMPGDTDTAVTLNEALIKLFEFIRNSAPQTVTPIIWCKGPQFDAAILTDAYNKAGTPTPWIYSNVRDLRTVLKLARIPKPSVVSHNALQDCYDQIEQLSTALQVLGVSLEGDNS
jgi:exodeoxyribonuclease VIII